MAFTTNSNARSWLNSGVASSFSMKVHTLSDFGERDRPLVLDFDDVLLRHRKITERTLKL